MPIYTTVSTAIALSRLHPLTQNDYSSVGIAIKRELETNCMGEVIATG
ncbi:MAG TPA: hypothetical protein V6D37_17140 [Candidatus Sericytochromatia bacterium]